MSPFERPSHQAAADFSVDRRPGRCPQCFSRLFTIRVNPAEAGAWRVVECGDCGLWHTQPRALDVEWDKFYPPDYPPHQIKARHRRWHTPFRKWWGRLLLRWYCGYPNAGGVRSTTGWLPQLIRPFLRPFLDPYTPPLHGAARLLDVGCGAGEYLMRMQELGWTVQGLDRSERAVERARAHHRLPVILGTLPSRELPAASFDLITAWQVLEHLDRPRQALAFLRTRLRPGGRLVVTVPNAGGWAPRWFGSSWIGWDVPRHITHFTQETLTRMLAAEGFAVVHVQTLAQSGWLRHSARAALRDAGKCGRRRRWLARLAASKLISRMLAAAGARRGRGEALYAVARAL